MNKEIKEKWLKALRSGDYKQGIGQLKNDKDEFCCLGVLCDIYSKETNTPWVNKYIDRSQLTIIDKDHTGLLLPPEVKKWAGIEDNNDAINVDKKENRAVNLTQLNDGDTAYRIDKRTFAEIANIIEEKL